MKSSGLIIRRYLGKNSKKNKSLKFLFENKDFLSEVNEIRKSQEIDPSDLTDNIKPIEECSFYCDICENSFKHLEHLYWDNKVNYEISSLMKKFNIEKSYLGIIQKYVIEDEIPTEKDANPNDIQLEEHIGDSKDGINCESTFLIRIFPDTTVRDITKALASAKKIMGKKKTRKDQYFGRDKIVSKLYTEGKTTSEINKAIGSKLSPKYQKSINSKFKKKINKPFS